MLNGMQQPIKEIELLDAMCGTGKSYNLFKFITKNPHERYLYVTPMLSEVSTRPAQELAKFDDEGITFQEPTGEGFKSKGDHLISLLSTKSNVICTHSLFQKMDRAGQDWVRKYGYTLILDEELGMIEPLDASVLANEDRRLLFEKGVIHLGDDGQVDWNDEAWGEGKSAFAEIRRLAENGSLYSDQGGTFLNVQLPVDLIRVAKRVIVATYLFEGSVLQAFLKVKGIGQRPFEFEGLELRDERKLKLALKERIEFPKVELATLRLHKSLKMPVDDFQALRVSTAFSASWYKNVKGDAIQSIGKHIRNVARHMDAKADDLIYTLPSSIAGKKGEKWTTSGTKVIKVKSFSPQSCYLQKGARATNDYADRTAAIHVYNRYPHPAVKNYLQEYGGTVDEDAFALAEMIQWFFRTAIRIPNGPKVKFHITSPRMEKLFKDWLDS